MLVLLPWENFCSRFFFFWLFLCLQHFKKETLPRLSRFENVMEPFGRFMRNFKSRLCASSFQFLIKFFYRWYIEQASGKYLSLSIIFFRLCFVGFLLFFSPRDSKSDKVLSCNAILLVNWSSICSWDNWKSGEKEEWTNVFSGHLLASLLCRVYGSVIKFHKLIIEQFLLLIL